MGSGYFKDYQRTLQRILMAELVDNHLHANQPRKLSIVGPCNTAEQWAAIRAERAAKAAGG